MLIVIVILIVINIIVNFSLSFPDSPESAKKEIEFFFPDLNVEKWLEKEEPCYRTEKLVFDSNSKEHTFIT